MISANIPDLLERLVQLSGCAYMSDLHDISFRLKIAEAVKNIASGDYPPQVWSEAVRYITGGKCDASSEAAARAVLTDWLACE